MMGWLDGQFYAGLGPDESGNPAVASEILAGWLVALGGDQLPEGVAARDAVSVAQVRRLLADSPHALAPVMSRHDLAGYAET